FKYMSLYRADIHYPGLMKTIEDQISIPGSHADAYSKPVVILINEYTQSQADSTVLAMKSIKNSITLGDNSAGTNGNVVVLTLPGFTKIRFRGMGGWRSDNQITQRTGLVPDIIIKEDENSLIKGEDVQLNAAIQYLNSILLKLNMPS